MSAPAMAEADILNFPGGTNLRQLIYTPTQDGQVSELIATFAGGRRYRYEAVAPEQWDALKLAIAAAASAGSTFNAWHRRLAVIGVRIDDAAPARTIPQPTAEAEPRGRIQRPALPPPGPGERRERRTAEERRSTRRE